MAHRRSHEPAVAPLSPCLSEEEVVALVAGQLAPAVLARAEQHLDTCGDCRALVAAFADRSRSGRPEALGAGLARRLGAFNEGALVADRYSIVRLIGAGGMGEVYEAFDTALSETVALKTIALDVPLDAQAVARLKAEVQLARKVTHHNVCRVFDLGVHEEPDPNGRVAAIAIPFLTMELLHGETLRGRLAQHGPLAPDEALALVTALATGLEAAHAAGVVHSDFKSDNIMLVSARPGPRVVIMDFGLARPLPVGSRRTGSGQSNGAGTLGYIAPEVMQGRRASPASDVYSLGVVFFEMLTGRLPYLGVTAVAVMLQALEAPPPTLASLGVQAPAWLDAVIRRCLEVDPARRWPTPAGLVAALAIPEAAVAALPRWSRRGGATAAFVVSVVSVAVAALAALGLFRRAERQGTPAAAAMPVVAPAAVPPAGSGPPASFNRAATNSGSGTGAAANRPAKPTPSHPPAAPPRVRRRSTPVPADGAAGTPRSAPFEATPPLTRPLIRGEKF